MTPAERAVAILIQEKRSGTLWTKAWGRVEDEVLPRPRGLTEARRRDFDAWVLAIRWARPAFYAHYHGLPPPAYSEPVAALQAA